MYLRDVKCCETNDETVYKQLHANYSGKHILNFRNKTEIYIHFFQ